MSATALRRCAIGSVLILLAGALAQDACAATPLGTLQTVRVQGCRQHPGTRTALRFVHSLNAAAANVSRGASLKTAIAQSGYREAASTLVHLSGDNAALQRALSGPLCETVTDPQFQDAGIVQRGNETWIVLAVPFQPPAPENAHTVDDDLLRLINRARGQARRCGPHSFAAAPPLQPSAQLRVAAEAHARDMLAHDYFAHEERDGSTPAQRVTRTGYRYRLVGENIASGPTTAQEAVDGWLASPGHCENLMDPRFTQSGVAYAASSSGPPRIYWVQDFAEPR